MGTIRKRKIRIKWKNLISLLAFTFLLIFGVTEIAICIGKVVSSPKEKKIEVKKKKISKNDEKLNKLNNIDKKINYFNYDYTDRYIKYKKDNKDLDDEQIIKNVNMNLDYEPYTNITKAKNLNTNKILVNKYYSLDEKYEPDNLETISKQYALEGMELVHDAKIAFEEMAKAAKKENLNI